MISLNDKVIIAFSDTHGNHRRLQVPEDADIVIYAAEDLPDDIGILVTHWPPYSILDNDLGVSEYSELRPEGPALVASLRPYPRY